MPAHAGNAEIGMEMRVKRAYEKNSRTDGARVLVDRLWPRGVRKKEAKIAFWAKELAPSNDLRAFLHKDPERNFGAFNKRYRAELKGKGRYARELLSGCGKTITLVTAVKDIERSHIPVLRSFLARALK